MIAIDNSRITAMLAQMESSLKTMQAKPAGAVGMPLAPVSSEASKLDFGGVLKSHLDSVNTAQSEARDLGQRFVMGDDSVALSDVMIAGRKSSLAFQTTVQVRNRLVAAYQEIMSMPV